MNSRNDINIDNNNPKAFKSQTKKSEKKEKNSPNLNHIQKKINKNSNDKVSQDIKENFDLFDVDSNGYLSGKDFKMALFSFGFEVEKSEIENLVNTYGNHGKINLEKFTIIIQNKLVSILLKVNLLI
jgi:Ca2+-binding EF-hand superfamily protein